MVSIKNVAIFGGSGALGAPILKVIVDSGKFNVTVVSREGSKATFPASIKVIRADYTSLESLTSALEGQDAVVSAVGTEGMLGQALVVDAAIAAGVKRFIPSEFGSDLTNSKTAALPVFGYKVTIRKHIEQKVAAGANITYTYVLTGGFLDWGLDVGFLLNWKEGKPEIYDGGDRLFSATTLESVGHSVVGVLEHYEETKNRDVFVQDLIISQNRLLEIAKKVAPEKKWAPIALNTADIEKSSYDALAKGDYSASAMYGFIITYIFGGEAYGQPFEKDDSKLLGVSQKGEEAVEAIWKRLLL